MRDIAPASSSSNYKSSSRRKLDYDDDYSISARAPPMRGASVARDYDISTDIRRDQRNYRSQSVVNTRQISGYSHDPYDQCALPTDHFTRAGLADDFHSYREPHSYAGRRRRTDDDATIRAPASTNFLSLEEECNWILSGRHPPPKKHQQLNAPRRRNDTLNDLLSDNATSDEEDTLDDISGDEVN
jgi:hypothetical protein